MANNNVQWIGLKELRAAIKRNPQRVLDEARLFFTRGLASYRQGVLNSPWRMGSSGGGAPVATGNLRDTHKTQINKLEASIGPNLTAAPYAPYVHGIKGYPRKRAYQLRPWLDYVKKNREGDIKRLYGEMLKNITADLAK